MLLISISVIIVLSQTYFNNWTQNYLQDNIIIWQLVFVIKQTRWTNFILEWNSTCFVQFLCPSSGVFHCKSNNGICHTACEQDKDVPSWSCSQAVSKPVWHIPLLCVQWKTPDDGQRNCTKHVEFHSKIKLWKLVHLVCFY